ncbi:MAG: hypothetical protein EBS89_10355, partial [Proteobacteria bacterium]|nr:hypothetical protein [Pseudomonadota bacterium]
LTTNTTYSVRAKVFDLAGKSVTTALSTSSGSLTIDTTVPSTAGTIAVSETDGTSGDGVVKTATPAFTVTSPADSGYTAAAIWKVQLQVASGTGQTSGFADTGSAVTSATSGVYTLTTGTLAAGTYTIRAVATDVAGNETITGSTVDIAVDLTAPTAGTVAVTDTYGSSTSDNIVRSGTPSFTVTGAADTDTYTTPGTAAVASVQLQKATGAAQTSGFADTGSAVTSATGGVYTLTPTSLSDGTYTVRALVTDLAGNQSTTSGITVYVDTTAPTAGTLTMTTPDNGSSGSDGIIGTLTPSFSLASPSDTGYTGAGIASVVVQVSTNDGTSWTTKGTSSSTSSPYAITLSDLTSQTTYKIQALVTGTVTMTTNDPGSDGIVNTLTPSFELAVSGTSDGSYTGSGSNATGISSVRLQVSSNGGTTWDDNATFTAPASGGTAYTVTASPALVSGTTYSVRALVTDLATNTVTSALSTTNGRITVDTTAPTVGTLTLDTDNGSSSSDGIVGTLTPAFTLSTASDASYTGTSAPTAAIASVVVQVSTNDGGSWTTKGTSSSTSSPYAITLS